MFAHANRSKAQASNKYRNTQNTKATHINTHRSEIKTKHERLSASARLGVAEGDFGAVPPLVLDAAVLAHCHREGRVTMRVTAMGQISEGDRVRFKDNTYTDQYSHLIAIFRVSTRQAASQSNVQVNMHGKARANQKVEREIESQ